MSSVGTRGLSSVDDPTGQAVQFRFDLHDYDAHDTPFEAGSYVFEVNIGGPNVWLQRRGDGGGYETVWESKKF